MIKVRSAFLLGAVMLVCTLVAGCNTVRGVGTDIHDAAHAVQQAIEGN
jgi:predicted small secreted protein